MAVEQPYLKAQLELVKADVGLDQVDNTSDANLPVSTAMQTALDAKLTGTFPGGTVNFLRADGTFAAPTASAAWGGITGTLSNQTDLQNALNAKGTSNFSGAYTDLTGKPTLGTAAATAITDYATAAQGAKADSALQSIPDGNVTLAKMANIATSSLIYRKTAGTGIPEVNTVATLKTDLALVKADVGLGSVDNTADTAKPVSTAQQTALDLKAPLASPTFTGSVTLPNGTVTLAQQASMATASLVYRKTAGSGAPEVNTLATLKTDLALGKADVGLGSVENTALSTWAGTANVTTLGTIGTGTWNATAIADGKIASALTGKSYAGTTVTMTGAITSSGGGIGYASGAGGTVSQLTSKSTGVTLNKLCGTITMHNAALAAAAIVTFTVTNSTVAATDVITIQHDTIGTIGGYTIMPNTSASGSFKISVRNNTAGSLSEAIVLRFAIIKGVTA